MRPIDLPRVLSPTLADACGISRARVRTELCRGRWRRLAQGVVLTRPDEPTRTDWAHAGLLVAGHRSALTGWDVVRLVGLGARAPAHRDILVLTTIGGSRRVGQAWIRQVAPPLATRLTSADDPQLPLVQVTLLARAIVDTAIAAARPRPVRALVTSAIQRELCSVEDLCEQAIRAPRRHSAALTLALADAVAGARSVAEAEAAQRLRVGDIPPFELNVPIIRAGARIAVADVLWRDLRAALEIDSREFHFSEADWKATGARHNRLTSAGLALTHYPPSATGDPGWVDEVAQWLRGRAHELGVPFSNACAPGQPYLIP
jgi:hypothetical protein